MHHEASKCWGLLQKQYVSNFGISLFLVDKNNVIQINQFKDAIYSSNCVTIEHKVGLNKKN